MNTNNPQKIVKIRDTAAQDIAVDNSPQRRKRRRVENTFLRTRFAARRCKIQVQ